MKKLQNILFYTLCIGGIIWMVAFKAEKKYAMQFNQQEIIEIYQVVDQSSAPHNQVKQVQEILNRELKQHIDSTGKFKP